MNSALFVTTSYTISILDKITNKIKTPFYVSTKQDAVRSFQVECKNPQSDFNKFPDDYTLICLGTFSDNGTVDTYPQYETLAHASQFRENSQG